ncbi:MAG: DNA polymerase III subunit alpha [SAR86 cluster bacterium]|uniref:DNA polymerase III subunit alpha n=1 Tax=SAR86 cluster bacterium TaxID=2030880 RepID=A0A520N454_9GAMM|nr:MAG: DNA polymerase III subunit alpha [SAR86 cluster bacterium]
MSGVFSHLRVSSEYSISQGLLTIDQIVKSASKHSIPSVALTDKSNMFGLVKFFNKCEAAGIKPISGASIQLIFENDENSHELLCLAKTNEGHKNLMKVISNAHNNSKYTSPVINFNELIELKNDIVAISGGKDSHLFESLKRNNISDASRIIDSFTKYFKDDFVLEVQRTNRPDEVEYFKNILPLAVEKGIPIVATNDVLFANQDDYEVHETKVCINTSKTLNDPNREKIFSEQQYFKSSEQMENLFKDCISLIENTNEISKKCNVSFDTKEYFLPEYPVPKEHNFDTYLEELSNERLQSYIKNFKKDQQEEYKSRLSYELNQIKNMGFSSYFLIVYDFIEWSKNNDVPVGPGRGSGAGSLVAFALGITTLDPIDHGLLFERFLNPERLSMPDFDIDFCMEKRDLVIDYVSKKYGEGAVSQIATFGTMAARAVVRDVARALGKPYALGDRISKMIPFAPGMTLDRAKEEQPLFAQSIKNDGEVREIVNLSYKLEGIARNVGKHAGGVVIAPGSISDFCPVYVDRSSSSVMTQYDKDDVEKIGLVKFDFLGLRTLTVIDRAVKSINKNIDKGKLDLERIPLDDEKVFKFLSSGKTMAVFQLESSGMRDLIKRLKPTKFEEITALLALYRPGPLNSGMHDEFVDRKHGRSPVTYPHKLLKEVLEETYGVIVYQEQVMEAARVLAGFSLGQADILRRAMGKKKKEEMEEQREIFVKGCENNDITSKNAEQIFDLINQFAEYGFNKSHSAAYALISYQTAYLKTYYPEHFMAAVLSSELGNTDKIHALIQECSRMKINVLNPNIRTSEKRFNVNKDLDIEYGLGAIKGVADAFIEHVCNVRDKIHFKDLWSFSKKIDIKLGGKKSLEALSQSGAFDVLAPSRTIAIKSVEDMLKDGASNSNNTSVQSGDLFSSIEEDFDPYEKYKNTPELTLTEKLEFEKKSLGYYLSGHPVLAIENKVKKIRSKKISELNNETKTATLICLINSVRQIKDRKGKPLTFINFNDGTGTMDGIVSSEILENCHDILKEGKILSLKGTVEVDDYRTGDLGGLMFRMRVKEILTVDSELDKRIKEITIDINNSKAISLNKFSEYLDAFNKDFWTDGSCRLNVRVTSDKSEAIIDIGDQYKFKPSLENFFILEDVFGKNIIEI